ncbi:MAG: choice-of-anchor D domain-containing protein [Pseudomonadales bacterium]|nr:choice-of-anchor D domain-containing protein [Pseudomonadales bacterium]
MSSSTLNKLQRGLILGVAGVGMLAGSGAASALVRDITVDFTCTYPLIGTQPLNLDGSADVPEIFIVGDAIPSFEVNVVAMLQGLTWTGMNIVSGKTLEGDVVVPTTIDAVNRLEGFEVEASFPAQPVPDLIGDFPLIITAFSPPLLAFTSDQVGEAELSLDGTMDLMIIARKDTGEGVIFAESLDDTGVFPVLCDAVPGSELSLGTSMVEDVIEPGEIMVSPTSIDFSDLFIGDNSTETVTVSNIGAGDLELIAISLGGAAFSQSDDCGNILAPGETCDIEVTFTAIDEGDFTGVVEIDSDDENNSLVSVSLTGSGVEIPVHEIEVDTTALSFGTLLTGTSATQTVTVSNSGNEELLISSITISGGDATDFSEGNDCGSSIAAGGSCEIDVTFMADGISTSNASLIIESNDTDEATTTVTLSGASELDPEPEITVSTDAVDFGDVMAGETPTETVTITNEGSAALIVSSIQLLDDDAASFLQSNDCSTVAPGNSCSIELTYIADGNATHVTDLEIMSNDSSEPSVIVDVTGTSVFIENPEIVVSPTSADLGRIEIGESSDSTVTISNTGNIALNISDVVLSGDSEFVESNNCIGALASGDSCTVDITFSSTGVANFSGMLTITSDDSDEGTVEVDLTAIGFDGTITIIPVSFDLVGETILAKAKGAIALTGTLDAQLDLASGTYFGALALDNTSGTFPLLGSFLSAATAIEYDVIGDLTGTVGGGALTADIEMIVGLPDVYFKIFGLAIRIGGGDSCQTVEAVTMSLASPEGEFSDPIQDGGHLVGSYTLPKVADCGLFTFVVNLIMAGDGNTIDFTLTP